MKDGIALIEIDLKNIDKVRKEWPFFKDRRPRSIRRFVHDKEPESRVSVKICQRWIHAMGVKTYVLCVWLMERGDNGEEKNLLKNI